MKRFFSSLLVPEMVFFVNPRIKKLKLVFDEGELREVDFSNYVICWKNFKFITTKDNSDWERIRLKKGDDNKTLVFCNDEWEDIPGYGKEWIVANGVLSPRLFEKNLMVKILPTGNYYVNLLERKLVYKGDRCEIEHDCSDLVTDFALFSRLDIDLDGNIVKLVKGQDSSYYFVHYPLNGYAVAVNDNDVINFEKTTILIENVKEDEKMTDKIEDELREDSVKKPEQELEELNEKLGCLRKEIADKQRMKEYENAAHESFRLFSAFSKYGFTREETMELLKIFMPGKILR